MIDQAEVMYPVQVRLPVMLAFAGALCLAQISTDPWPPADLLQPGALAQAIKAKNEPTIISVAFPVLYRQRHIVHALNAGPGSKPEGLEALKKAVSGLPHSADILIYCGCCPMTRCPNVRPAYRMLKEVGFTHIRVLDIPTNMHDDWHEKGYPSEDGTQGD